MELNSQMSVVGNPPWGDIVCSDNLKMHVGLDVLAAKQVLRTRNDKGCRALRKTLVRAEAKKLQDAKAEIGRHRQNVASTRVFATLLKCFITKAILPTGFWLTCRSSIVSHLQSAPSSTR